MLRGGSNPRRCITQDSEPNTLLTELFRPRCNHRRWENCFRHWLCFLLGVVTFALDYFQILFPCAVLASLLSVFNSNCSAPPPPLPHSPPPDWAEWSRQEPSHALSSPVLSVTLSSTLTSHFRRPALVLNRVESL